LKYNVGVPILSVAVIVNACEIVLPVTLLVIKESTHQNSPKLAVQVFGQNVEKSKRTTIYRTASLNK
jgi:hypothetical protein